MERLRDCGVGTGTDDLLALAQRPGISARLARLTPISRPNDWRGLCYLRVG